MFFSKQRNNNFKTQLFHIGIRNILSLTLDF